MRDHGNPTATKTCDNRTKLQQQRGEQERGERAGNKHKKQSSSTSKALCSCLSSLTTQSYFMLSHCAFPIHFVHWGLFCFVLFPRNLPPWEERWTPLSLYQVHVSGGLLHRQAVLTFHLNSSTVYGYIISLLFKKKKKKNHHYLKDTSSMHFDF